MLFKFLCIPIFNLTFFHISHVVRILWTKYQFKRIFHLVIWLVKGWSNTISADKKDINTYRCVDLSNTCALCWAIVSSCVSFPLNMLSWVPLLLSKMSLGHGRRSQPVIGCRLFLISLRSQVLLIQLGEGCPSRQVGRQSCARSSDVTSEWRHAVM